MLKDFEEPLLHLTFDQLRTLVLLGELHSPRRVAQELGRDQSSVMKQVATLNTTFEKVCGRVLASPKARGQDYAFTPTFELAERLARETLERWNLELEQHRRHVGQRVVIATTTFTLPVLARVWERVRAEIQDGVEVKVEQIRTAEFWDKLGSRAVDLVIGGQTVLAGHGVDCREQDFLEWHREGLAAVTNIDESYLPGSVLRRAHLENRSISMILPRAGIIADAIRAILGADHDAVLLRAQVIQDVHYGLALLETGVARGVMFATASTAEYARSRHLHSGVNDDPKRASAASLRILRLGDEFPAFEIVTGLFGRKGERKSYEMIEPAHPLAAFWRIFTECRPSQVSGS